MVTSQARGWPDTQLAASLRWQAGSAGYCMAVLLRLPILAS